MRTGPGKRSAFWQIMEASLVGAAVFTVISFATGFLPWFLRDGTLWRKVLASYLWSILYDAFYFALLAALFVIPLLILVRRALSTRIALAIVGALLCPLVFFAPALLLGVLGFALAWSSGLSAVMAGGAMGWSLAAVRPNEGRLQRPSA